MRRALCVILALSMILSVSGCISSGGGGEESNTSAGGSAALDQSDVTLVFNFADMLAMNSADKNFIQAKLIDFITMAKTAYAAPLYDYVTTLYIRVSGPGMDDVEHTEDISDAAESFSVTLTIPNGSDRTFYVELRDRNDNILYSGSIVIDVGDSNGSAQDISISVTLDEEISAEDYIEIGRDHLEEQELEPAFIAFDTAVAIDADHPVANFFRGFTRLLLLIQKDNPDVDVVSPDADITSALNLYIYGGSDDIYSSQDDIAPDIYNEGYAQDLTDFFDSWERPSGLTTDSGVDLIEDVSLPEIDKVIDDLANAAQDPVFYTTLTTAMHFELSSLIKVDRGDVYILEAIAYGLKAYYNHILAYQLRSDIDYWADELEKKYPDYIGLQNIIDGRPAGVGESVGGAGVYLSAAKSAYSSGLDKLKAGLQFIDGRSSANEEGHIFDLADDDVDIPEIITAIDETKLALSGPADIDFDDDTARLDLSELFSSPDINSLPEFYYHALSDQDLPIFDTNAPEPGFDPSFNGLIREVNGREIYDTEDPRDGLVNALREELMPVDYKFVVPTLSVEMTGDIDDFSGVWPVMAGEEEEDEPEWRDMTDVYMSRDDTYLYVGMKFRGSPYDRADLESGEWINYHLFFNAENPDCSWDGAPVIVHLYGDSSGWQFNLHSYGSDEPVITSLSEEGCSYNVSGDIIEFQIPLDKIVEWIDTYQAPHFPDGWDGKELFTAVSFWRSVSSDSEDGGDHVGDCLAELNI